MPSIDLIPRLRDIYALEKSGTGSDSQTRPILIQMGEHARVLMLRELDLLDRRHLSHAGPGKPEREPGSGRGAMVVGRIHRGLYSSDRDNLRAWIEYANKIGNTAESGRRLAINFGGTGEKWDPVISKARYSAAHADQVLAAE